MIVNLKKTKCIVFKTNTSSLDPNDINIEFFGEYINKTNCVNILGNSIGENSKIY